MTRYRVRFCRDIWGVPFEVGAVTIRRARDPERALQAAGLRFARQAGLPDWRLRADHAVIDEAERD